MRQARTLKHTVRVTSLVAGFVVAGGASGAEVMPPDVLTFATGYKMESPTPRNVVELGVIKKCDAGWCMTVERFDSAKMLPRVATRFTHEMHAPYGGNCSNGSVGTVKGEVDEERVYLHRSANGFAVVSKRFRYVWVIDDKAPNGYKIAEIDPAGDAAPLAQAIGFAFGSASEMKGKLSQAELSTYYKGEIYHKVSADGVGKDWTFAPSTIDFRVYKEAENGDVLIQSRPGDPSIIAIYGAPMWVHSTVVLARGTGTIDPVIQEYGHDFNKNGCFDEPGHDKRMLPVGDGTVNGLVYIEYNSDFKVGFPILSVGRYYR